MRSPYSFFFRCAIALFLILLLAQQGTAITAPLYPTRINDNFSDNSFNTSLWRSNLSGTGTVEEATGQIFINETATSSAAIVSTLGFSNTYQFSIDINVTSLNSGTVGLSFQDTYPQNGTNAYVSSVVRGGIVFSQGLGGIAAYYYNLSSGMVYWDEINNTWTSTATKIPYALNTNYTFTIERHMYFYYFKVTNVSSGTVLESSPIFTKVVRGGATAKDYVYFGDAITNVGWSNSTYDNVYINTSDTIIPFQNNMADDIDAYYRMTEDFCHACWVMGTGVDGWWQYSTFNNSQIVGMETTIWLNHLNDANNVTFTTNLFTSTGAYRLNVPQIPLSTVTESIYQPFEVYNITDDRGFRINGTYPDYYLYINGTTETGETLTINLTYNLMPSQEHWFRTDGYYYVAPSNVSGNITLDGTTYIISNGFSSWEHGWGEENIDVGSSGGGGEYYNVFPINGFVNGSSIYYRMSANGNPVIRDAGITQNGYEWYNATYKALERTVNGTWQIITKWNVSSIDSSSGMSINYTGQLLSQFGIGPGADGGTGASRGIYNITGNYTYPNATLISISGDSVGYHQVAIDTLNPVWRFVPCTWGCQNVSNISISSGNVTANWTAFNSSYLIQNVYFNVTYPNGTTITNLSASLQSGTTQSGIWSYPIDSVQTGNYIITSWSNDSRGVWNRTENMALHGATSISFVNPTPVNDSKNTTGYVTVNTTSACFTVNCTAFINWNNSLVLWLRMNEDSGGVLVEDFSGYGNNGTWNGNTTSNVTNGRFGNALSFDGINDYVNLGTSESLRLNDSFTIQFWANVTNYTSASVLLRFVQTNRYSPLIDMASGKYRMQVYDGTHLPSVSSTTSVSSNMVLVTAIRNTEEGRLKLYIDNRFEGNVSDTTKGYSIADGVMIRWISINSGNYVLNGTMDELRIYNRVLSHDEINASYNASLYRLSNNFTSLQDNARYNYTAYIQDTSGTVSSTEKRYITINTSPLVNPFVAVGVAAMGTAIAIAIYNMYRRRGRPHMMFIPVI